ncbi:uncharacterized protein V1516DRAFT_700838 [Lipomyces oligophaga]|uniref:uncharacterized protein n=1 Tax=Lipomyces oligophaga TaxID=45792 RepID=UPI0034CF388C
MSAHAGSASISNSLNSISTKSSSLDSQNESSQLYNFQRMSSLTVDDLLVEMVKTEKEYLDDLRDMAQVHFVSELLICHAALQPSLSKVLVWAEEAAPIYRRYVSEYVYDPQESEELIYLRRRPLVRLRFFSKFFKKLDEFLPNVRGIASQAVIYKTLVSSARAKVESERIRVARMSIDFSKVRSFDTLQPVATNFNPKSISLRSYCQCHLRHRTGRTFSGLPVELLLISEPLTSDALAICQLHELQRYLLFPTFRRADLVYSPTSSASTIVLTSYDGSLIELEFSSIQNRNTWASKLEQIFPQAPSLPAGARPRRAFSADLNGLQISTAQLESDFLDSELQSPRLFEEPEIKPFIVQSELSPKKRNSVIKMSPSPSKKRHSVRFGSRIVSDSRLSLSSSSGLSPYRKLQLRLIERQRAISSVNPPIVDSVLKEESPYSSPNLTGASPKQSSPQVRGQLVGSSPVIIRDKAPTAKTVSTLSQVKSLSSSNSGSSESLSSLNKETAKPQNVQEPASSISLVQASPTILSQPENLNCESTSHMYTASNSMISVDVTSAKNPVSSESPVDPEADNSVKPADSRGILLVPNSSSRDRLNSPSILRSSAPNSFRVSPSSQEDLAELNSQSPRENSPIISSVNTESSKFSSQNHRKGKTSFSFTRKPKRYVLNEDGGTPPLQERKSSVTSLLRNMSTKTQSNSGKVPSNDNSDSANSDKNISVIYSRLNNRRSSTALCNLSPNVGSPHAGSPITESPALGTASMVSDTPSSISSQFSDNSESDTNRGHHRRTMSAGIMRTLHRINMRPVSIATSTSPILQSTPEEGSSASLESSPRLSQSSGRPRASMHEVLSRVISKNDNPEKSPENSPRLSQSSYRQRVSMHEVISESLDNTNRNVSSASDPGSTFSETSSLSVDEGSSSKSSRINVFSRTARKARAALAQNHAALRDRVSVDSSRAESSGSQPLSESEVIEVPTGEKTFTTISTKPPSPNQRTSIVEVLPEGRLRDSNEEEESSFPTPKPAYLSRPSTASSSTSASIYVDAAEQLVSPTPSLKVDIQASKMECGDELYSPGYPPSPGLDLIPTNVFTSKENEPVSDYTETSSNRSGIDERLIENSSKSSEDFSQSLVPLSAKVRDSTIIPDQSGSSNTLATMRSTRSIASAIEDFEEGDDYYSVLEMPMIDSSDSHSEAGSEGTIGADDTLIESVDNDDDDEPEMNVKVHIMEEFGTREIEHTQEFQPLLVQGDLDLDEDVSVPALRIKRQPLEQSIPLQSNSDLSSELDIGQTNILEVHEINPKEELPLGKLVPKATLIDTEFVERKLPETTSKSAASPELMNQVSDAASDHFDDQDSPDEVEEDSSSSQENTDDEMSIGSKISDIIETPKPLNFSRRISSLPVTSSRDSSHESLASSISRTSTDKSLKSIQSLSRLRFEYDPNSGNDSKESEKPIPKMPSFSSMNLTSKPSEEMKVVLCKCNAFVYEWRQNRWDRLGDKELRVIVTVTEDSGCVEVWPASSTAFKPSSPATLNSQTSTNESASSPSGLQPRKTRSVTFNFGGENLNMSHISNEAGPVLTILLNSQSSVRRSTAFDIHVKRSGAIGTTMFRVRAPSDAEHLVNAMNSCRLDFKNIRTRSFVASGAASIASSSSSISSSGSKMKFPTLMPKPWYNPVLDDCTPETFNRLFLEVEDGQEVMLIKNYKCRLYLRQNALKWRNLGAARVSVAATSHNGGNLVSVIRRDGAKIFEMPIEAGMFEKLGKLGISLGVNSGSDELVPRQRDNIDYPSGIYMLQFRLENDVQIVYKAIKETAVDQNQAVSSALA